MKCVVCHGENIQNRKVKEELAAGSDIVVLEIEAQVCAECGERYYDRRTLRHIEAVREQVADKTACLSEVGKVLAYGS